MGQFPLNSCERYCTVPKEIDIYKLWLNENNKTLFPSGFYTSFRILIWNIKYVLCIMNLPDRTVLTSESWYLCLCRWIGREHGADLLIAQALFHLHLSKMQIIFQSEIKSCCPLKDFLFCWNVKFYLDKNNEMWALGNKTTCEDRYNPRYFIYSLFEHNNILILCNLLLK